MFNLCLSEIVLISIIALIFIGPKQLPEIARALGRALNELKKASEDLSSTIINPKNFINGNKTESQDTQAEIPTPPSHGGYEGHEAYEPHDAITDHYSEPLPAEMPSESIEGSENKKEDLTNAVQIEDKNKSENKKADT